MIIIFRAVDGAAELVIAGTLTAWALIPTAVAAVLALVKTPAVDVSMKVKALTEMMLVIV